MRPQSVLATYWLLILGATAFLYADSLLTVSAVGFLLLVILSFTIGVSVSLAGGRNQISADHVRVLSARRAVLKTVIIFGSACNVIAGALALQTVGLSLADVVNLHGLLDSANSVSVYRYAHGGLGQLAIPALLTAGYAAAIVSPFIRITKGKHNALLGLAPVASSLVYAAFSTERLGFIFCAAATGGGWIAVTILKHGALPRLRWRAIVIGILSLILVAVAFTAIAFLRVGRIDSAAVTAVSDKQVVYAFGGLPAFSQWYERYRRMSNEDRSLGYGTASLAGVEYLTGLERDETRGYGEFVVIDGHGRTSNVYTGFRALVLDFGEAGSILVMSVLGFLFGRFYQATRMGSMTGAVVLAYGYALIFVSPWSAITTFTNVVIAGVLALITLGVARSGHGLRKISLPLESKFKVSRRPSYRSRFNRRPAVASVR
jgi:oligosaccharide repeat unit polymerase